MRNFSCEKKKYSSTCAEQSLSLNKRLFRANSIFCPRDEITIFSRRAEKAKYLTKSSEVMRNFAGEKKKYSSNRAEQSLSLNKCLFPSVPSGNKHLLSDKLYSARFDEYCFFSPAKLRITSDDFVRIWLFLPAGKKNIFSPLLDIQNHRCLSFIQVIGTYYLSVQNWRYLDTLLQYF